MKIVECKPIQHCFDGTFMKEVVFDEKIDKAFIDFLGETGTFEYFGEFARPFFRVQRKHAYILKGVEGNAYVRLYLSREFCDEAYAFFSSYIERYTAKTV